MLDDILFKLARKNLSGRLYRAFSTGPFGRTSKYDAIGSYEAIIRHYQVRGLDFQGKRVLEVGSGNQFYTPFHFLAAGARLVLIAEPMLSWDRFERDLEIFNRQAPVKLDPSRARKGIRSFRTTGEMPAEWNGQADIICSHNVLEHFEDLAGYFADTRRLLSPEGVAYNKVDLSDHTYHIFAKYPFTQWLLRRRMLHHLRYSQEAFHRLNDPKCYMNRVLLPTYLEMVRNQGLQIRELVTEGRISARVHPDLLAGVGEVRQEHIQISGFGLTVSR